MLSAEIPNVSECSSRQVGTGVSDSVNIYIGLEDHISIIVCLCILWVEYSLSKTLCVVRLVCPV